MGKDLIIVESPAKVKTIKKFLGDKYMVQASVGHVRDLPTKTIGVDEGNNYEPAYKVIEGKEKVVADLKSAAAKADHVFLAPDPDREGEAIAWHVAELIKDANANIERIQFNEITAKAVKEALANPRPLNRDLFDAQQARRVLDRLVGYKISPLLWKKVKRGISAGRVQSVALRLIVEREQERRVFVPEEYWNFRAFLAAGSPPVFRTDLVKIGGKKAEVTNAKTATEIEERVKKAPFVVESVEAKEREKTPVPPFITSTLQQNANQRLGYSAKRTMNIAQRLYEGLDLGERGTTALITYMRTDSVRIADEARDAAREFIVATYGADYYPPKPRHFKSKGGAQDAHEAVRPVDVALTPDSVKPFLTPEQYNLYRLIWVRFVASQMAGARVLDTTATVTAADTTWRAKGEQLLFPGFQVLSPQKSDDVVDLPPMKAGQTLTLDKFEKEQKFTQPAPRYTEASLVRELEEKGIGRPSTYASIISTLQDREYVSMEEKHFAPTDLGEVVSDLLKEHFKTLMDVGFTAQMEDSLDKVADGGENWVALLDSFTGEFNPTLEKAAAAMNNVKGGIPTGLACPTCGKDTVVKFGKAGPFLACTGYPDCTFTSNFTRDEKGAIQLAEREKETLPSVGACPECGKDLVVKKSRTGSRFIACTGYPDCKHAEPFSTGVPCPKCGKGMLVEKSSKRGKVFYACDQYPQCDFAIWDYPIPGECPKCKFPLLGRKNFKGRTFIGCTQKGCNYREGGKEEDGE
ncbi:DNA topoisomerase 1 [uncultured delta proteobacterium]|uniref:DNA topoisomerase 1 n=1 Tax=uncultured delta proteobacterium TaxID=34034 RepID=A0A212JWU5_9DELT|nr:DNA topoisomerase 1 [uncultured delta proteobacterium]